MIKFINDLDTLRDELYDNSKEILRLLEKRKQIAMRIGEYKIAKDLKIRNREREIEILKSLSDDQFKEAVLNILFEFSINYEVEREHAVSPVKYSKMINGIKYVEYRGEIDNLIFILSRIFNPGTLILCRYSSICEIFGMGGHHITERIEIPDLTIYLDGRENQDIIIGEDYMLISEKFLTNKGNIYKVEIR
ncbi:MAG: chorismate mutase [Ferroplasma sp. Type II]|uniref:chorismate mutase n=1 Tax=Ferroplasma sp. Type II TaxID=261388 RepID=UPI000389590E|nr:chorismate mutase [Ferroplasma sp. Type II]EQB73843.1 MAG: chorismate mutase [Ferroplasma sp. Type II]